jgi:rhamnosyl/mannosyltransferase
MTDRLKVLHVGKFYPPHMGGIETHVQVLAKELTKYLNVEVLVANDGRHDEEFWDAGAKINRVGVDFKLSGAPVCRRLAGKIRRARADLVHLHLPNPPAILSYLISGHTGPVIATYHSDIVRQQRLARAFLPILRMFLRRCKTVVATSARYIETSSVLADFADKCQVIPYGIPLDDFGNCDATAVSEIRRRYGRRIIVSVGRLVYYKGYENLVDAMKRVDAHLIILGEGHLREHLEQQARNSGVSHKVSFLGEIQNRDVAPFYHAADVFALPSVARSEAFGIVQLEAMACGTPVVNTNLDSGVPTVSLNGITGLTVPPHDPVALSTAISRLLDDSFLRESYGRAAKWRVKTEFSEELMLNRTLDLYRKVLSVPAFRTEPAPVPAAALTASGKMARSAFSQ